MTKSRTDAGFQVFAGFSPSSPSATFDQLDELAGRLVDRWRNIPPSLRASSSEPTSVGFQLLARPLGQRFHRCSGRVCSVVKSGDPGPPAQRINLSARSIAAKCEFRAARASTTTAPIFRLAKIRPSNEPCAPRHRRLREWRRCPVSVGFITVTSGERQPEHGGWTFGEAQLQCSNDSRRAEADCLIMYRSGSAQNSARSSPRLDAPP